MGVTEPPCCTPETSTTLQTYYTLIRKNKTKQKNQRPELRQDFRACVPQAAASVT